MAVDSPYYIYISEQPGIGARAKVYKTPIENYQDRTETTLSKGDVGKWIMSIRSKSCQEAVSEVYIQEAITVNTILLLMFQTKIEMVQTRSTRHKQGDFYQTEVILPVGFILAQPDENGYYIDVICSIRNTSSLLHYFIDYCGGKTITLRSLPNVLAYYPKFQFEFRESCDKPIVLDLPDSIKTRNTKVRPFPKTAMNAYDDDEFSEFMLQLIEKGLAVKKDGDCGKPKVSKAELKSSQCGDEGFTMMRCANRVSTKRIRRRSNRSRKRK